MKGKGRGCTVPAPKAKTPPAKRMAEGGDITSARTFGESQRYVPRAADQRTSPAGEILRRAQGIPQQHRRMDDSPATMAKNRAEAAKARKR